jgi:Protein of unknown function (DUF3089)
MTAKTASPKPKTPPAMRFLWWVGTLTLLAVLLAVLYRMFETRIERWAMAPRGRFAASPVDSQPDYGRISRVAWVARPGLAANPAQDAPPGFQPAPKPPVDVFILAPTAYYSNQRWNAPLADAATLAAQEQVARTMATAFNNVGAIYMPRTRQATFGTTFIDDTPDARAANDLAYSDVLAAFDVFQATRGVGSGPQRPFILAAHEQGARLALRLLKDRLQVPAIQRTMVVAYIVGHPVSVEADLAPMGLRPCETPQAINCVMSWQSFGAHGANSKDVQVRFDASTSDHGVPRKGTRLLCTNPITGWIDGKDGSREANLGALANPLYGKPLAALLPRVTGASCNDTGFLLVSPNPGVPFEDRKMRGENYGSYDYTLFWANVRANAEARVSIFYTPR